MTQTPLKKRRTVWIAAFFLLAAGGGYLACQPWKSSLSRRIETMLAAQGYRDVHLDVTTLTPYRATISNLAIGTGGDLKIGSLTAGYTAQSLQAGALEYVAMKDLSVTLARKNGAWDLRGLQNAPSGAALALPVSRQDIAALRFHALTLEDGRIVLAAPPWRAEIPVALEFRQAPDTTFSARFNGVRYAAPGLAATARAGIEARLDAGAKHWDGKWRVDDLTVTGGETVPPPFSGSGIVSAAADAIDFSGELAGKDKAWRASFTLNVALSGKSEIKIASASMPWEGGTLSLHNAVIPVGGSAPIRLNVQVSGVSVDGLLKSMTGQHVSATGTVSGTLPVVIDKNGAISLAQGELKADGPGIISMPPDAVPGDNAQVDTLRMVLRDFHYSGLSIAVGNDAGSKLSLLVTLEGSNPGAYGGHPVKLNVHLAGDVLDFIRQNVMFLTDPKALLKQGQP